MQYGWGMEAVGGRVALMIQMEVGMSTGQIKTDLSYTYQSTSIGLEIRSQDELDQLVDALQSYNVVVLHDHHRDITIHIYLRFRELQTV